MCRKGHVFLHMTVENLDMGAYTTACFPPLHLTRKKVFELFPA